MISHISI
ncbi:hypothetical protein D039_3431A, partial [Vibrio parahaemolyticus EKP-028]